jgi:hypothetical protein
VTQRSELKQRYLETKAQLFGWLASRLFTHREGGVDGLVKRMLLPNKRNGSRDDTAKRNVNA